MTQTTIKISEHFTRAEWDCSCCHQYIIKQKLVTMSENFRQYLCDKYKKDVPLNIHCVYRCPTHNEAIAIELCYKCGNVVRGKYTCECPVCESENIIHKGAVNGSYHMRADAVDCRAIGISIHDLHDSAEECHKPDGILSGGLGKYPWGIHYDIGPFRRW